jgi:hypothetical protein
MTRELLDRAIKIFGGHEHFKPEAARVHFKRGTLLRKMGKQVESDQEFAVALELFNKINAPDRHADRIEDLSDADFDRKVMFWSR